ncbi:MAG: Lrp/AsnC ligand binding domain-containing protein [Betaproteobacteria bacterium]|nr:Lrp/AsnC ligand binding domain-containing protein [Betaproteobacteria bacterium]
MTVELDMADRRILTQLQGDGRISNAELARRVHLSPSACLERTRRLERNGTIARYTAVLDPQKLGAALVIFVQVSLHDMTEEVFSAFHKGVQGIPEIQECHMVSGGFDYLLKVRVADMQSYRKLHGDILSRLPHVRETHTYVVMQEVKDSAEVPVPAPAPRKAA